MCTGIRITANGGEVFWGRTMDLAAGMFGEDPQVEIPTSFINISAGTIIDSQTESWKAKYSVVGVGSNSKNVLYDGVNDAGLAGDLQVLMECTHDSEENIKGRNQVPVLGEEFVTYILSQFSNVQEIRDVYQKYALVDQKYSLDGVPLQIPLHYSFVDDSGDGIVLEPVENGGFRAYDYLGVMTNSPEYDYHSRNINNYIGLSTSDITVPRKLNSELTLSPIESGTGYGLFGLPGDYTSPSRFVRGTIISNNIDDFDADEGINQLYAVFRPVIIPRGLEHSNTDNPLTDFTRYWSGYDLQNRKVYAQTGQGLAISSMDIIKTLNEVKHTPIDTSNNICELVK